MISTTGQRSRWLRELGADEVIILDPAASVAGTQVDKLIEMTAQQFVGWLIRVHNARGFVEGTDFRFGKGRQGTFETMRLAASEIGGAAESIEPVETALTDGSIVPARSGTVRSLLVAGRVADAAKVLGRPFEILGRVVQGDRRGRLIGFPTANIDPASDLPADGVYAGFADLPSGAVVPAAISVGTNPTFTTRGGRTLETHLLGVGGPGMLLAETEYGWPIRIRFLEWLRPQSKFDSLQALVAAISNDCERVARITARDIATFEPQSL